jgi:ferrous iron transport protein B
MKSVRVALLGNPNAGKTTLFNALTGSKQHVGNWPGKTVERKSGSLHHQEFDIELIDLPGIYSLSAFSDEEIIARNFLLENRDEICVVVLDASNLERNLYLLIQILEMQIKPILVLSMSDVAEARGHTIDDQVLSHCLGGIPVVRVVAHKNRGLNELKQEMISLARHRTGMQELDQAPESV